ncbi:MAG: prephenate/arogenate dehydrogenase family protein [Holosporales bacterium]|jgi:cyclohexadieny/prephenate dehydrogenase
MFKRVVIVGCGLIGSSLLRIITEQQLASQRVVIDADTDTCRKALALGLATEAGQDALLVRGGDLVVLATPVGEMARVLQSLVPWLEPGCIVTDVGSVKKSVIMQLMPLMPPGVLFVPGHPIAGTEFSGIDAGFSELFKGRWCILTPEDAIPQESVAKVRALWEAAGSIVALMPASHHDKVLAMTSHLPHLIAYTIVGTAFALEESEQAEVMRYSAGGFRDFTRIAASDPVMWRDIFLNNREAVLEVLGRFTEDLASLQKAIRFGDGEQLFQHFTRTRAIRKGVLKEGQA